MRINLQLFGGRGTSSFKIRSVKGYTTKIHQGRQDKHIPGSNNFQQGKSEITISQAKTQELVNQYGGKGRWIGNNKEKVNFNETIGRWYNPKTRQYEKTSWGIIHYSKDGTHIVPTSPDTY